MIKVRKYVPDDYMRVHRRYFDSVTFMSFPDPQYVAQNLDKGAAYTLEADGEVVACGGIVPLWKKNGEAWIVSSQLVTAYPFSFAKGVWRELKRLIVYMDLDRIQTSVDVDHLVSQRWVERMGFEREGLMRRYIGGRDFYRYAKVKEE